MLAGSGGGQEGEQGAAHHAGGADEDEVLHVVRVLQRVVGRQVAAQAVAHQDHLRAPAAARSGTRQANRPVAFLLAHAERASDIIGSAAALPRMHPDGSHPAVASRGAAPHAQEKSKPGRAAAHACKRPDRAAACMHASTHPGRAAARACTRAHLAEAERVAPARERVDEEALRLLPAARGKARPACARTRHSTSRVTG